MTIIDRNKKNDKAEVIKNLTRCIFIYIYIHIQHNYLVIKN